MFLKNDITLNKKEIEIQYFKLEQMNEFNYLIVLLANKALEKKGNFDVLLKEFTKGNNDLYLILKKRFKENFKVNVNEFIKVKDKIELSMKTTKKAINKEDQIEIYWWKELNLYFYENKFLSETEIKEIYSRKYNTENIELINIEIINDKNRKNKIEKFDFILNDELTKFNLLNIRDNINNKIINELIENIANKSYEFLPENNKFPTIENWNPKLKQLARNYEENKGNYIEIINLEEKLIKENLKIEMNILKGNVSIIINNFSIYKKIPFVEEEEFSFDDFRSNNLYQKILILMDKKKKLFNESFYKYLIKYATTIEEFILIKEYIGYKYNKDGAIKKINLMIENDIDIINDENFIEFEMFERMIKSEFINYYKYLNHFHRKIINKIPENKKISLLNEIYLKNNKSLNKIDEKWIIDFRSDRQNIFDQIRNKISNFTTERGWIQEINEKLTKIKKDVDDKNFSENIEIQKKINNIRNLVNISAHFTEKEKKKNKIDDYIIKHFNNILLIKEKFLKAKIDVVANNKLNYEDLNFLDSIKEYINKTKKEIEKYVK